MKKFQFRLQVVLDIKEKLLEQKLLELSKVQRGLQEAIDKQINHYTNLCEMNRGYDDRIYYESLGVLNKLQSYSTRINNSIKNKIFSLE